MRAISALLLITPVCKTLNEGEKIRIPIPCISMPTPKAPDMLSEIGIKLIRTDFMWHEIEPEKGNFKFDRYEKLTHEIYSKGLSLIAVLGYGNLWASDEAKKCVDERRTSCYFYPPDNPDDFARFALETSAYFKQVKLWEIWNEPNVYWRFFRMGNPEKYAKILAETYKTMKRDDIFVSFAGVSMVDYGEIAPGGRNFIDAVLKYSNGMPFDAISYHPYPKYPPSEPPESYIAEFTEALKPYGKPLWVTEIGWPTSNVSEKKQRDYLVRAYLLLARQKVEIVCFYTFSDYKEAEPEPEKWFGIVDVNFNPKPAYTGIKVMNSLLERKFYKGSPNLKTDCEGFHILEFEGEGQKVLVGWCESGSAEIKLGEGIAFYLDGTTKPIEDSVVLSQSPVFFLK